MNRRDQIRAFLTLCLMREVAVGADEEPGLRAHLLALSRAQDAEEVAAASVAASWANVQRAVAEGQPEARLRSLAATWLQAKREAERAARLVAEAESEVVGALGVRRAEP